MRLSSVLSSAALLALVATPAIAQRAPGLNPIPPHPQDRIARPPTGNNVITPQGNAQNPNANNNANANNANANNANANNANANNGNGSTRVVPTCDEVKRKAKYGIYFDKVEIEKLVQTVADATCKTFILPENLRGKISIIGPENGKVEVDGEQFYAAFLAALDANGLAVYPYGRFLKIVDKNRAKQSTIPTLTDETEPYTTNEQMITRLFKVKYSDIEPLRGVLQQLVTKDGDTIPFQPDTIIVNDIGSNMHRLEKLVDQLDRPPSSDQIRVLQIKYATAQDIADKVTKLFENKNQRPGVRQGVAQPPQTGAPIGQPVVEGGASSGGPATLSQLIPDERTNKLIVIASPAAMERIQQLIDEIDIPISGEGRVNVYYLENAAAEDLASTLSSLSQGTANRPKVPPTPQGGQRGPVQAAELFSGEVKISADKATNSLVIVASQSDYRNLVKVIEKLDIPRRQVFVEAVIMEVNLDRSTEFGMQLHTGLPLTASGLPGTEGQTTVPLLLGTKYSKSGLPPSFSIANLANFGGFLAGLQGPAIPELEKLGINVPAFGVVLHALQQSSDVNVLSTPHILTSDNEEAEITVGQNVPFQAGYSPSSIGSLAGAIPGAAGATAGLGGLGGLGALTGGLGSLYAPISRQNVELKLTVKPQINESDYIRLVINEQTEEIASSDPVLGPTTAKRSAKTTVVARDQETVVIGGIMQDRTIESVSKVPLLGDIPILGHLFREQTHKKVKTNLLLFLTPYIIKDSSDFRRIFDRKMAERQEFVEQFYGSVPTYEVAIDFSRKAGPLAKLNQAILREENKIENGGPGSGGEKMIQPKQNDQLNGPPSNTQGGDNNTGGDQNGNVNQNPNPNQNQGSQNNGQGLNETRGTQEQQQPPVQPPPTDNNEGQQ
ncbi:MAG: type II secretion system secretin GspD [Myxococcaceae bacterium]